MNCLCRKLSDYCSDGEQGLDRFLSDHKDAICNNKLLMNSLYEQYKNYLYKLARKILMRYPSAEITELINEGFEGVLCALEKYDYTRSSFLTYAQHWVRMKMTKAARRSSGVMSFPGGMYSIISKVKALLDEDPSMSCDALAAALSESTNRISIALTIIKSPKVGGCDTLEDFVSYEDELVDTQYTDVEEDYADKDFQVRFWQVLSEILTPREVFVLELLFGKDRGVRRSLEWVAKVLSVSKERIRQIKYAAFEKLKDSEQFKLLQVHE